MIKRYRFPFTAELPVPAGGSLLKQGEKDFFMSFPSPSEQKDWEEQVGHICPELTRCSAGRSLRCRSHPIEDWNGKCAYQK